MPESTISRSFTNLQRKRDHNGMRNPLQVGTHVSPFFERRRMCAWGLSNTGMEVGLAIQRLDDQANDCNHRLRMQREQRLDVTISLI